MDQALVVAQKVPDLYVLELKRWYHKIADDSFFNFLL